MADLTDLQSAQTVKIAGSDSSGIEQGYVNQFNSQIQSADILNGTTVQTTLSVTNTAQQCKVGASNLANRKMLIIQAQGTNLTYGFASGSQPFNLPNGTTLALSLGPNISLWVRRTSAAAVNVAVSEIS